MQIICSMPAVWLIWGMLILGLALSLAGLRHSCERFWHWRQARALHNGEIVPAETLLAEGLAIKITPQADDSRIDHGDQGLPATLNSVGRRTLTLALDTNPALRLTQRDGMALLPDWVKLGATVNGAFVGENAHYRFAARVQDVRDADGVRQLSLSVPRWLERTQRRSHFRVSISDNPEPLPATFECAEGYPPPSAAHPAAPDRAFPPQHGMLINLSIGGLCADLSGGASPLRAAQLLEQFAPGSILCVRLPIAALSSQSILVRVRECERVIARGGLGVRISCVFVSMPVWEQELVAQKISEVQHQQLRERRQA